MRSPDSTRLHKRIPLDIDRVHVPRGQVHILLERCKGCAICVEFCPRNVLQISEGMNARGYHYPEIAQGKEEACVHCEFCTLICPEFAIFTLLCDQA